MQLTELLAIVGLPLGVFAAGISLMQWLGRTSMPKGEKPLNTRFGYTADQMKSYWGSLKNANALETEVILLKIDLVFPVCYGAALLVSTLNLWSRQEAPFPRLLIIFVVGMAVLSDWAENSSHLYLIRGYISKPQASLHAAVAKLASLATQMKWVFILASWGLLIFLIVKLF